MLVVVEDTSRRLLLLGKPDGGITNASTPRAAAAAVRPSRVRRDAILGMMAVWCWPQVSETAMLRLL